MPKYKVGITEINTLVRRLGYVSAILRLLEHRTLSESMLYTRLEKWSFIHQGDFIAYANPQGFINATHGQTGPKRYTNFAVSLGTYRANRWRVSYYSVWENIAAISPPSHPIRTHLN